MERFVPVSQDNWGVLIGQSGQQCKVHIIHFRVQFYMMATGGNCCCCLCISDLSTSQTKKWRKKVHRSGSNVSRVVLEIEVEKLFELGLHNIVETHQDSYICRQCDTNLVWVSELEHSLGSLSLSYIPPLGFPPQTFQC